MGSPPEDIVDVKIPMGIFSINVRAFWRWFTKKKQEGEPVLLVARRFLQSFEDHGVAVSQIPRLIPQVSLDQLHSEESLLPALTPEVLRQTADLFGIRREWLEGTTGVIYDIHPSYKNPWAFFDDVKTMKIDEFAFPLVAFCSSDRLDSSSRHGTKQPIVLVLRESCAELEDKTIYRYRIHDEFCWGYWKCRIQLKAMTRIWYKKYQASVPIYRIDKKALSAIEEGLVVPRLFYQNSRRMRDADLKDYSLLPSESRQSKDEDEFPTVLAYIETYKLEHVGEDRVRNPSGSEETHKFT